MKKKVFPFHYLFSLNLIVVNLFLIGIFFQIYLITQVKSFYNLLKILFIIEIILLISALVKGTIKKKVIILVILFIVVLRLPFYFYSNGLITTSDNALEALQCEEIRDTRTVPFFLFESIRHNGTVKYLPIAFLWDFFGSNYLYLVLFQLIIFIVLLFLIYEIFKPSIDRNTLFLFILVNFAFIEVVFNYSLSIRGGVYLELLLFFFLGVYLFDFKFTNNTNIFLSYYFVFFSIYIHPIAMFFALSFALCTMLYSLKSRKAKMNFIYLLGGLFTGCFHLLYYIFFKTKPAVSGAWETLNYISLSDLASRLVVSLVINFKVIFWNIFSFETSYLIDFFNEIKTKHIFSFLNKFLIYSSLVIFIIGLILVIGKLLRILLKKEELVTKHWPYLFFVFLFLCFVFKLIVLKPPRLEPRHNFDLVFLIILSYLFVFSYFLKGKKIISLETLVVLLLLLLFTSPHYYYFLKMAQHKKSSYHEILSVLSKNRVKYLATDFIIAYPIHFLSHRRILVSDSLGPLTIRVFSPDMRAQVDKIPGTQKAYLFFSPTYPARKWHKNHTRIIKNKVLNYLKTEKSKYKTYKFKDFILIIPSQSKFRNKRISLSSYSKAIFRVPLLYEK